MPAFDAVEHLVGMQAQIPLNPYLALWSRLDGFEPDALGQLLVERRLVRLAVMRSTIHLVSARDCLVLRPSMQPVLDAELRRHPEYAPKLDGIDIEGVLVFARALLAETPRSGPQLRAALAQRFGQHDAAALAYACRCRLALVQVPPRGVWGQTLQVTTTTAESWLGRPLAAAPSIDAIVLRYLAAFGPATVADIASWSRLTGMRAVVERVRPQLCRFTDERARELWDLPDAPRPDPDTPAPPRFLPEYDNVLLSHADRARFASEQPRVRAAADPRTINGTVLDDGVVCATWRLEQRNPAGTAPRLVIDPIIELSKPARAAIASEGERALRFLAGERATAVCITTR